MSWDAPGNLRRCATSLALQMEMRRRYSLPAETDAYLTAAIRHWRVALSFLLIRQIAKARSLSLADLKFVHRIDPLFFSVFPLAAIVAIKRLIVGRFQPSHPFEWISRWSP